MNVSSDLGLKNPRIWKWQGRYYSCDGRLVYSPNKVSTLSEKDSEKYIRELGKSQGFDVNYYPGMCYGQYIIPVGLGPNLSFYERFAKAAVRLHNERRVFVEDLDTIFVAVGIDITKEKSCGPVSFERIIKLMGGSDHFFITLEAQDLEDGCVKIYQTIVQDVPGKDPLLKLFRLKPGMTSCTKEDEAKTTNNGKAEPITTGGLTQDESSKRIQASYVTEDEDKKNGVNVPSEKTNRTRTSMVDAKKQCDAGKVDTSAVGNKGLKISTPYK